MLQGKYEWSRRAFIKGTTAAAAMYMAPSALVFASPVEKLIPQPVPGEPLKVEINGRSYDLLVDARTSLLDLLREQLHLTGTKKGCDMGHCGACIVHVNGSRVNACLSLAVENNGSKITTIEGLAKGNELHPLQQAFIKNDAFQCGYCTSGQIMSGVACVREGKAESRAMVQNYMEGNICRCGCYQNIVNAILEVRQSGATI